MNRFCLSALAAAMLLPNTFVALAQEKTMTTSTGMELVWIPPGEFMLGSTPEEQTWAIESGGCAAAPLAKLVKGEGAQPRRVAIREGFWMGRTEVTVAQWKQFADETGYKTDGEKSNCYMIDSNTGKTALIDKTAGWRNPGFEVKDDYPACCISWNDARQFCDWLNQKEQTANKLPAGSKYRLPTEAEWEYACRGGPVPGKFWWGDSTDGAEKRFNIRDTSDGFEFLSPVDHFGKSGRNRFGLADMLGNVREWCMDSYDANGGHPEYYNGNPSRVLRGGSMVAHYGMARCAWREQGPPVRADMNNGFRVSCGLPEGSGQPSQSTEPLVAPAPPPPAAPTVAKGPTPAMPPPPAPGGPTRAPATPPVATAKTSPPAAHAVGVKQTTFEISNISTSSQYAYVNNSWIRNALCVQVTLRVNEDVNKNPPSMKAYFFNKDREMVKELTRPTSVSFGNRESMQSPERFQPGRKYTIYFGISEGIQRGKDKWKHVIVMFGNRENATAEIHPKEDIGLFEFPEKALVMKGRGR